LPLLSKSYQFFWHLTMSWWYGIQGQGSSIS
jgi:hypothetical protein